MEVTECTKKKKEQKNCKTLVKGVLVLFFTLPLVPWVCTLHSQHELVDLQSWVAQEPRACTLNRGSAEVQTPYRERGISPPAFHWIPLCGPLLWCKWWAQPGVLPSTICSGNTGSDLTLAWQRSFPWVSCHLCHRGSKHPCPYLLYTCVGSGKTVD